MQYIEADEKKEGILPKTWIEVVRLANGRCTMT